MMIRNGIGIMRSNRNIELPSELWARMAETAKAEGRSIDELVEEATLDLLKLRELRRFVAGNTEFAAEKGLTEADVPRLIAESRAQVEARDLGLINKVADELNDEVEDVLRYQQT